jgi:ribosomal protein L15E
MTLQDAIYNWLSIRRVAEARPNDYSAQDTYQFFEEILVKDHKIEDLNVQEDEQLYHVYYVKENEKGHYQFPIELVDALLQSIESEPKYNQ